MPECQNLTFVTSSSSFKNINKTTCEVIAIQSSVPTSYLSHRIVLKMKSNMPADISYTIEYSNEFATLAVNVPDLDLEQEASFVLEVHESELVFTLPPHHAR